MKASHLRELNSEFCSWWRNRLLVLATNLWIVSYHLNSLSFQMHHRITAKSIEEERKSQEMLKCHKELIHFVCFSQKKVQANY